MEATSGVWPVWLEGGQCRKVQAAEATGLGWIGENGLDFILLTVKSQGPRQGLSKGETSSDLCFSTVAAH